MLACEFSGSEVFEAAGERRREDLELGGTVGRAVAVDPVRVGRAQAVTVAVADPGDVPEVSVEGVVAPALRDGGREVVVGGAVDR